MAITKTTEPMRRVLNLNGRSLAKSVANSSRVLTENGIEMVDHYNTRTGILRTFYRDGSVQEGPLKNLRIINYLARDLLKNRQFEIAGLYVEGSKEYEYYDNLLRTPWKVE